MPFTGDMNLDLGCPEPEPIGLPVELSSFTAVPTSHAVELNWTTASELNNDRFVLERSADGQHFFALSEHKGQGNSYDQTTYQAIDHDPLAGRSFYRLTQIDFDGTQSFSPVVTVEWGIDQATARLFPNPVSRNATPQLSLTNWGPAETIQVSVLNYQGKLMSRQWVETDAQGHLLMPLQHSLTAGTYQVLMQSATHRQSQGLVVY